MKDTSVLFSEMCDTVASCSCSSSCTMFNGLRKSQGQSDRRRSTGSLNQSCSDQSHRSSGAFRPYINPAPGSSETFTCNHCDFVSNYIETVQTHEDEHHAHTPMAAIKVAQANSASPELKKARGVRFADALEETRVVTERRQGIRMGVSRASLPQANYAQVEELSQEHLEQVEETPSDKYREEIRFLKFKDSHRQRMVLKAERKVQFLQNQVEKLEKLPYKNDQKTRNVTQMSTKEVQTTESNYCNETAHVVEKGVQTIDDGNCFECKELGQISYKFELEKKLATVQKQKLDEIQSTLKTCGDDLLNKERQIKTLLLSEGDQQRQVEYLKSENDNLKKVLVVTQDQLSFKNTEINELRSFIRAEQESMAVWRRENEQLQHHIRKQEGQMQVQADEIKNLANVVNKAREEVAEEFKENQEEQHEIEETQIQLEMMQEGFNKMQKLLFENRENFASQDDPCVELKAAKEKSATQGETIKRLRHLFKTVRKNVTVMEDAAQSYQRRLIQQQREGKQRDKQGQQQQDALQKEEDKRKKQQSTSKLLNYHLKEIGILWSHQERHLPGARLEQSGPSTATVWIGDENFKCVMENLGISCFHRVTRCDELKALIEQEIASLTTYTNCIISVGTMDICENRAVEAVADLEAAVVTLSVNGLRVWIVEVLPTSKSCPGATEFVSFQNSIAKKSGVGMIRTRKVFGKEVGIFRKDGYRLNIKGTKMFVAIINKALKEMDQNK